MISTRLLKLAAWLVLAAILFITVSPSELRPHDPMPVNFDRAAAFALLGALFVLAYPKHWLQVGIAIVLLSGGLELLQELSPTRHARLEHAMIKSIGALIGVTIGWSAIKLVHRWQR